MKNTKQFQAKEVTNVKEFIQEVQRLDLLNQIYNCFKQIGENVVIEEKIMSESELTKFKKNSDKIYLNINFLDKLISINKIVKDNRLEESYKPINKLENIQKDISKINSILLEKSSLESKYGSLSKEKDYLKENLVRLLEDSKEVLIYENSKKYTEVTNNLRQLFKSTSKPENDNQLKFLSRNKKLYSNFQNEYNRNIEEVYGKVLNLAHRNKEIVEKYEVYNYKQISAEYEWMLMYQTKTDEINNIDHFLSYLKEWTEKLERIVYQKQLDEIRKTCDQMKIKNSVNEKVTFYRGQESLYLSESSTNQFSIVPSLMHNEKVNLNEYEIFQDLLRLDPDAFLNQKSFLDIHKEMQHYSEISRVIDITTQALTGLFFAVGELKGTSKTDPYVFMFSVDRLRVKRPESDGTQIKLALSTIKDVQREKLRDEIDKYKKASKVSISKEKLKSDFNSQECVKKLVYSVRKNDGVLEKIDVPEDIKDIEFVLPTMNNKRIIAQQGAFIAVGLLDEQEIYETLIDFIAIPKLGDLMMIKIDKDYAYKIKLELEQLGISKAVMYPDINKIGQYFKSDLYPRKK